MFCGEHSSYSWLCVAYLIIKRHFLTPISQRPAGDGFVPDLSTSCTLLSSLRFLPLIPKQAPPWLSSPFWAVLIPHSASKSPKNSRKLSTWIWDQTCTRPVNGSDGRGGLDLFKGIYVYFLRLWRKHSRHLKCLAYSALMAALDFLKKVLETQ